MRSRWALGMMLLALAGLSGCGHKPAEKPAATLEPATNEPLRVRVATAQEVVADETLAVTGSIFAGTDVNIASKIGGKVVAVGADEGQRVPTGRVLVQLDSRAASAELRRLQAALDSARAAYQKAVLGENMVRVQAETSLRSAEAEQAAARARLNQAVENSRLASTKSGSQGVDIRQAELNVETARSRLAQAQESLRITRERAETDTTGAAAAVNQAAAAVPSAQAGVTQAETALQLTEATTASGLENARQAVLAAQSNLEMLQTGSRSQERAQARSQVEAARAALRTAEAEYNRVKYLFDNGAVSRAQLDNAQLVLETRREQVQQAEQALSLVEEGPRTEQVSIARTQLNQAQEQLRLATASRDREIALRQQDVTRARQELERTREAVTAASANLRAAQAARGQVSIQEQAVAQAEQGLSQAEQAARLAAAGVSQAEVARQEVLAARTAVSAAEQRVRLARSNLIQPRLTTGDIRALAGQVRQAEAGVVAARVAVSDHVIAAPVGGGIAEKKVDVGEVVSPGQGLFRLVSDDTVHFNALVPEEKVRFVSVGMPVAVNVDALPARAFAGRVLEVLPAADLRSRTFTVKVGIPNPGNQLREGMFARGQIVTQRNRRSLRVPADAVVTREQKSLVVRIEGANTAVPVPVELGSARGGSVEILSGALVAGDRVVTEGATEIEASQPVNIITEEGAGTAPAAPTAPAASPTEG